MELSGKTACVKEWLSDVLMAGNPFVAYRLPSQDQACGIIVSHTEPLNLEELTIGPLDGSFVVAPFDRSHENGWLLRGDEPAEVLGFSASPLALEAEKPFVSFLEEASSRKEYQHNFGRMMEALNRQEVDKVVLARRKRVDPISPDLLPLLFEHLCRAHPGAFVYMIDHPEMGCWMGASPEAFLKKEGPVVETVALAATRHPIEGKNKWDHKELEEQGLVSAFIDEVLEDFGLIDYERSGPETVDAGEMVHLKTTYSIKSDSLKTRMGQFMMALHPTPALCGLPKDEAFRLIKEGEGFSRQLYGGFLGPVSGNDFQFFVNIRCMKMSRKETFLYLGGGLTRESEEEKEWEETRLKARTLLRALHTVQKSFGNESPNLR